MRGGPWQWCTSGQRRCRGARRRRLLERRVVGTLSQRTGTAAQRARVGPPGGGMPRRRRAALAAAFVVFAAGLGGAAGGAVRVVTVGEQLTRGLSTMVELCRYARAAGARVDAFGIELGGRRPRGVTSAAVLAREGARWAPVGDYFPTIADECGLAAEGAGDARAACPDGYQLWAQPHDRPARRDEQRKLAAVGLNQSLGTLDVRSCADLDGALRSGRCGLLREWRGVRTTSDKCGRWWCRLACGRTPPPGRADNDALFRLAPAFLTRVGSARATLLGFDGGRGAGGSSAEEGGGGALRARGEEGEGAARPYVGLHLRFEKECGLLKKKSASVQVPNGMCEALLKVVGRATAALKAEALAAGASVVYVSSDLNAVHGTLTIGPVRGGGPCGFAREACARNVTATIASSGLRVVGLARDSVCEGGSAAAGFKGTECTLAEMAMLGGAAFVATVGTSSMHHKFHPKHYTVFT